jgi:hypothetical protein
MDEMKELRWVLKCAERISGIRITELLEEIEVRLAV